MQEEQQILSRVIVEIAGKPKEHIESTMKLVLQKIKESKDIKIEKEETFDAKEKEGIWNIYTELEIKTKDIEGLIGFCFDYMPSSVEIIEPDNLKFDTNSIGHLINDLLARLHTVDVTLKKLKSDKISLESNGTMLLRNIILISVKEKEKDLNEMSALIGIKQEELKPFVDSLVKEGKIIENNTKYSLKK
ncbi:MAG: hypothetical protein QF362_01840 [Candidatus Woesearchaeota archaeon]|jgi:hypothetical protein|nr:hypothetical protein [Candidatus Woesearchaeota archaeon]MDP7506165.1 hypothetical protein [Candidatus Woesearchaeota archaeon]|tara:strand:- start:468 stop:1037 length:570 start_codon:yes stop_codon:yes gene_type:complete